MTASDLQAMQYLQASLALSIYRQRQARNLLLLALGMRCHRKRRGRFLFYATLFNYEYLEGTYPAQVKLADCLYQRSYAQLQLADYSEGTCDRTVTASW